MTVVTKVCELYAVDATLTNTENEFDVADLVITRIKNVDAHKMQDIIDAAPDAHKKVIMDVSLDRGDKVTITLKWDEIS